MSHHIVNKQHFWIRVETPDRQIEVYSKDPPLQQKPKKQSINVSLSRNERTGGVLPTCFMRVPIICFVFL